MLMKSFGISLKACAITLFLGASTAALPAFADVAARGQECLTMLRVVGVAPDDVLNLRTEPHVPKSQENSNRLIGIPANARWIEQLEEASGTSPWL